MALNKSTKEIYNYAQELENRIVFLRGLLRQVIDQEGNLPHQGCKCPDCDLYREIEEELADAVGGDDND